LPLDHIFRRQVMLQPVRSGSADRFHPAVLLPCRLFHDGPTPGSRHGVRCGGRQPPVAVAPSALEAIWPQAADISHLGPTAVITIGRDAVMQWFAREVAMGCEASPPADDCHVVDYKAMGLLIDGERTSGRTRQGRADGPGHPLHHRVPQGKRPLANGASPHGSFRLNACSAPPSPVPPPPWLPSLVAARGSSASSGALRTRP